MSTITKCDACGTTSEDCLGWIEWTVIDHRPRTLADKPLDGTRSYCPRCREIFLRIMIKAMLDTMRAVAGEEKE